MLLQDGFHKPRAATTTTLQLLNRHHRTSCDFGKLKNRSGYWLLIINHRCWDNSQNSLNVANSELVLDTTSCDTSKVPKCTSHNTQSKVSHHSHTVYMPLRLTSHTPPRASGSDPTYAASCLATRLPYLASDENCHHEHFATTAHD